MKSMKLAIDATPILPGRKGLGLFFENFLDELTSYSVSDSLVVYIDEAFWQEAKDKWPSLRLERVKSRPALLWEQIHLPRRLRDDDAKLLFTGRDRTCCEPKSKTVVYLFEVPDYRVSIALKNSHGWYPKLSARYSKWRFGNISGRVSHFIASSKATLSDLVSLYKVPRERIEIVYPGIQKRFFKPVTEEIRAAAKSYFCEGKPYVLHFATGDPRDNTRVAVEAFSKAHPGLDSDLALLLAGTTDREEKSLRQEVDRLRITDRTYYAGFLKDDLLAMAYQGAEAYLDPTLYEGFGVQLAEAMASGIPVLSSRISSVPEVVGESGLLFDPLDVDGFASGLQKVLRGPMLREGLVSQGRQRAARFSWKETVERIMILLEQEFNRRS
jgi:glycosyltransferase involved in cell wall biosynthesis